MSRRPIQDLEFDSFKEVSKNKHARRVIEDNYQSYNSLEVTTTVVDTSVTKIITPNDCDYFYIEHQESGEILYMGSDDVTTSTGYPLKSDKMFECKNFFRNDNNEIYAVTSTGSINVYCVGFRKI